MEHINIFSLIKIFFNFAIRKDSPRLVPKIVKVQ